MRYIALMMLALVAGCSDGVAPAGTGPVRHTPDPSEICPGFDCRGMHRYDPPSKCASCGIGNIPTLHHYCTGCAARLSRCAHCGRKSASEGPTSRKESPPPDRAPDPAPPPPAQEPRKAEEPKAPVDFNLEEVKGEKLAFEEADRGARSKVEHPLIVFACPESQFQEMRRRHLQKEGPGKPAASKPADELIVYVLWGDRLGDPAPEAIFDRKAKRIVVTAKWSGQGFMDTGTLYRGYGFKLGPLEAGEYGVWVREATPVDKDGPKLTKSLVFEVR